MSNNPPLNSGTSRRVFIAGAGALGATILGGAAPAVLAKTNAPLKIGVLNSFSKVFAALASANLNGMNLYFDQIGNPVAGRKIEIVGKTTKSTGRLDCRSYANLTKAISATSLRRFKPVMSRWQQSSACGGARLSCCAPAPAWPRFHVHSCPTFFAARCPLMRCTKRWGVAAEFKAEADCSITRTTAVEGL